jgi:hypothetical protein
LLPFADEMQRAMAALEAEVRDVGGARLRDPQAVQPEQHRQGGMVAIEAFGGEQERAQLSSVHAVALARLDLGSATYSAGFEGMRPSM